MQLRVALSVACLPMGCGPRLDLDGPPNIVFVLVDDLGATDLGVYGSDLHLTPHIDTLAVEGVRFDAAYSASVVCSPSRAAILTGQHPARLHLTDWIPGEIDPLAELTAPDWTRALPAEEANIATVLGGLGYRTAWHGKWHLGGKAEDYGFDEGVEDWDRMHLDDPDDPKGVMEVTELAERFIRRGSGPFFVAVSHYAVHVPLFAQLDDIAFFEERLQSVGSVNHVNPAYAALLSEVDDSVGHLMEFLEDEKLLESTIVVVTSDNGGKLPQTSNAPLRLGKSTLYEGGLRVPLIVWAPERYRAAVSDLRVTSEDLLPTFAEWAGGSFEQDGRSLVGALEGAPEPKPPLFFHYPHNNLGPVGSFAGGAMRRGDFKLVERFGATESVFELYDLVNDPGELLDVSGAHPEETAELAAELEAWRVAVDAQEMTAP